MHNSAITHAISEKIKAALATKSPVIVLDVDNLLYTSADPADKETNYERVSQNGMRSFLRDRFGVNEELSAKLRMMLKLPGIGNGSTIAGLYALCYDRATGKPRPSKALETLLSKDQDAITAMVDNEAIATTSRNNMKLRIEGKETLDQNVVGEITNAFQDYTEEEAINIAKQKVFYAFAQTPASDTFPAEFDSDAFLQNFAEYAWKSDPVEGQNMKAEQGVAEAIKTLYASGAKIYAHSNSHSYGVNKILRAVMGDEDFTTIFGEHAERVYGVDKCDYHAKPTLESYQAVIHAINEVDGIEREKAGIFFFDDSAENCLSAVDAYDFIFRKANRAWRNTSDDQDVTEKDKKIPWHERWPTGRGKELRMLSDAPIPTIEDKNGALADTLNAIGQLITREKNAHRGRSGT